MTRERNDTILEIYKLHAELADRVSQRRMGTNQIFGSLLIGVLLFLSTLIRPDGAAWQDRLFFCVIALAGALLSMLWYRLIISYSQLNESKFKLLVILEEKLPFSFYKNEWELLGDSEKIDGNGRRYVELSKTEKIVPRLFLTIYVALCAFTVFPCVRDYL